MATNKTNGEETIEEVKELNLDAKVTVKNIADWTVGFQRKVDGMGDVSIAPRGSVRISRNEIIAQCQTGNRLFLGTDNVGSHATLIISDTPTRVEVGFESEDGTVKQNVFSDELVQKVFGIKDQKKFETAFQDAFQSRAEQYAAIEAVRRLSINDYKKVRFAEKYTGYTV